jgi:hypothetical protein
MRDLIDVLDFPTRIAVLMLVIVLTIAAIASL